MRSAVDVVSADTEDLSRFVERGVHHGRALDGLRVEVAGRSRCAAAQLAWNPPPPAAVEALDVLIDRSGAATALVDGVATALRAFDTTPDTPQATVVVGAVDLALVPGSSATVEEAGRALVDVTSMIDAGDDLAMTNGELNRVADHLADLDGDQVGLVLASLSDRQLEVLFHNVHSSGFWSNDWNDRERTDFYRTLEPVPTEIKLHVAPHSPYLEALAEAELGTAADVDAQASLTALHTAEGFTDRLDFERRVAVLWQAAHHPSVEAIDNLARLVEHGWFQGLDLADTQRSAKMIGYLSEHKAGDAVVIDNTLDRFLEPDAPYRFDWDRAGTAFGSAGGSEAHFNRAYLDAGNDPVLASVPAGVTAARTERMLTHTVAHEVNHLVNGDRKSATYEYFMAEYRAFYVGFLAQYGHRPTRADVEARVELFVTAGPDHSYHPIAQAVDDPVEGPRIAAFAVDVLGRPVTAEELADELAAGVTDPDAPAPVPIGVDGGSAILDNSLPGGPR